jgi:hypothetical protein
MSFEPIIIILSAMAAALGLGQDNHEPVIIILD